MIGMQMSGFQDIYEVTENLGEPSRLQHRLKKKNPFITLESSSHS